MDVNSCEMWLRRLKFVTKTQTVLRKVITSLKIEGKGVKQEKMDQTQVKVSEGVLEGRRVDSELGYKYYSFKRIPYATPPLGQLRFKAPLPPKPWAGVLDAKEHGPTCSQFNIFTNNVEGMEDCLYLNVYTKELKPNKPLPVMVWIHGGAFISGSGNDDIYGPDFLVDKDVILVTINYRLELLGFLCLDIPEVPGNAGLKDQVQALRWVQKNIQNFGGDPNNVTIFGESAGGSCVGYHCVSPMSKDLFKRAILQSGTLTNGWSNGRESREHAFAVGRMLGKETDDPKELYEFLLTQKPYTLVNLRPLVLLSDSSNQFPLTLPFGPTSEKIFGDNEYFFSGQPYHVLRQGIHPGVDVMTGYMRDEGVFIVGVSIKTYGQKLDEIITRVNSFLEISVPLSMKWEISKLKQLEVARKIRNFYYGDQNLSKDNVWPLIKWASAEFFIYGLIQFGNIVSTNKNKVYMYEFNCISERNQMGPLIGAKEMVGDAPTVCHFDDMLYLFQGKMFNIPVDKSAKSWKMIDQVTKLWTNFAKFGNPTPDDSLGVKWLPYTANKQDYLDINEALVPSREPCKREIEFWEGLYKEYLPTEVMAGSGFENL